MGGTGGETGARNCPSLLARLHCVVPHFETPTFGLFPIKSLLDHLPAYLNLAEHRPMISP